MLRSGARRRCRVPGRSRLEDPATPSRAPRIRFPPTHSSGRERPTCYVRVSSASAPVPDQLEKLQVKIWPRGSGAADTTERLRRRCARWCRDAPPPTPCAAPARRGAGARQGRQPERASTARRRCSTNSWAPSRPTTRWRRRRPKTSCAPAGTRSTLQPRRCSSSASSSRASRGSAAAPTSSSTSRRKAGRTRSSDASARPPRPSRRCTRARRGSGSASTATRQACPARSGRSRRCSTAGERSRSRTLFEPAIGHAENGVPVGAFLAKDSALGRTALLQPETLARFRRSDGTPLQPGDTLVQRDLANTFQADRARRDGASSTAERSHAAIVEAQKAARRGGERDCRAAAGRMTLADVAVVRRRREARESPRLQGVRRLLGSSADQWRSRRARDARAPRAALPDRRRRRRLRIRHAQHDPRDGRVAPARVRRPRQVDRRSRRVRRAREPTALRRVSTGTLSAAQPVSDPMRMPAEQSARVLRSGGRRVERIQATRRTSRSSTDSETSSASRRRCGTRSGAGSWSAPTGSC